MYQQIGIFVQDHHICSRIRSRGPQYKPMVKNTFDPGSVYLRASLIAQLVKNLPAMQETPVQFLCTEDLLEKG